MIFIIHGARFVSIINVPTWPCIPPFENLAKFVKMSNKRHRLPYTKWTVGQRKFLVRRQWDGLKDIVATVWKCNYT